MKRLYLLRHAKSSWAQPGQSDIDRRLDAKGQEQCKALNHWLTGSGTQLNKILCSPSVRTIETMDGIRSGLKGAEEEICEQLYEGSLETYLEALWVQTNDNLMIIGHNPTCDELCFYLTAQSSPKAQDFMNRHFGTAMLAVFDFPGDDWSKLSEASCQLIDIIRPKDDHTV